MLVRASVVEYDSASPSRTPVRHELMMPHHEIVTRLSAVAAESCQAVSW